MTETILDVSTLLDSGTLIQRALITNHRNITIDGWPVITADFRHGPLPGKPTQSGWWIHLDTEDVIFQIPDQAASVLWVRREGLPDATHTFTVLDLAGQPLAVVMHVRLLTVNEISVSWNEFIQDYIGDDSVSELKMRSDYYEVISTVRGAAPAPRTLFPYPLEKIGPDWTQGTQDDESADFRWLRHMRNRGQSDQEMLVYAKTRMMEIMNQIVVHTPWYKPEDLQKVLEQDGHNLKILTDFILSLKKPS